MDLGGLWEKNPIRAVQKIQGKYSLSGNGLMEASQQQRQLPSADFLLSQPYEQILFHWDLKNSLRIKHCLHLEGGNHEWLNYLWRLHN